MLRYCYNVLKTEIYFPTMAFRFKIFLRSNYYLLIKHCAFINNIFMYNIFLSDI